ncbi:MAG: hypothetical protein N2318_12345 [Meiothermus sp.]|nr:hypothetical protein [Meiothermus sp.]
MKHTLFFVLLVVFFQVAFALEVPVAIQSVIDGRTLEVLHPGGAITQVRLAGLGAAKREVLVRLAPRGTHGFLLVGGTSPQTRPVIGFFYLCPNLRPCTTATLNLNAEVLRQGGAKFVSNFEDAELRQMLIKAQLEAQQARRGVWAK